ncbi:MFS transporter [Lacticaseibacillus chiayiensis]|uniref:MFS transporter n=1 Tax=Lacticaseibacillus chiayiensis TaxID=2100821 RepID=A0A4Q1TPT9_9LACO|nr:MFS transporter [Lacticaseibacillus chiayiensis]QVI35629.1 MFS transporter [Lacticaseibacillus chiayiensis]RXT20664.1 MFS transporter [Lacticaseibacillus chiayiensis]RXT55082.1 MFS transporter [Lacticaseibacillus chiayiensis]UYN57462.1 MFS transporter [Lacticaseibacillus chiayiensis]
MAHEIRLRWLLTGALLSSIGMSFIWPLTSIYLHNRLGISLTVIGVVLLLNSLGSVIGSIVGGRLYDQSDPYRLTLFGVGLTGLVLIGLTFWHGWPAYCIWLTLLGIGSGWNITMVNSLGTSLHSKDGRYVFTMLYFAQNVGVVIGTTLVGFVYDISVTLLLLIAVILYSLFFMVVLTKFRPAAKISKARSKEVIVTAEKPSLPSANKLMLTTFFFALLVFWLMYQQWSSNLSVYMTSLGIPLRNYSFLWTLNAALIVVIQLFLNWFNEHVNGIRIIYQILFGLVMVAISFLILITARTYTYFVIAMIALTIGEATASPAIPALVNDLTPRAIKGRYQGFVTSWGSVGRALGPLFGGLVIDWLSYRSLFIIAATGVFTLIAILLLIWLKTQRNLVRYQ